MNKVDLLLVVLVIINILVSRNSREVTLCVLALSLIARTHYVREENKKG